MELFHEGPCRDRGHARQQDQRRRATADDSPTKPCPAPQAEVGTRTMYGYPQVTSTGSALVELVSARLLPADSAGSAEVAEPGSVGPR